MTAAQTVILIAHQGRLEELLRLMEKRREVFEHYRLLATTETGRAVEERLGLDVTHLFPGRKGGEIQLCGLVCTHSVRAVYFLRDPVGAAPDEPDITPFYRACDLHNVPLATNMGTAVALTQWLGRKVGRERAAAAEDGA